MRVELLNILRCPSCRKPLSIREISQKEGEEIITGKLFCKECKRLYPIVSGVPEILDDCDENTFRTARSYNLAYNLWWKYKLADAVYVKAETEKIMDAMGIKPDNLKSKRFLDAGCGMGIIAYGISRFGCDVVAIDISESVQMAFKMCKGKNIHFVKGDLAKIPFKENCFDFIYCGDVLMNVSDPKKVLSNFFKLLKRGGKLFVTFYNKNSNITYWKIVYPVWKIISKLPFPIQDVLSWFFALVYIFASVSRHKNKSLYYLFRRGRALYYEVFGTGFYHVEDPAKIKNYFIENNFKIIKIGFSKTAFKFYIYATKQ